MLRGGSTKDGVHEHFIERTESYDEGKKARIFKKCKFCGWERVFRNLEQLVLHLSSPTSGSGGGSGGSGGMDCPYGAWHVPLKQFNGSLYIS